MKAAASFQHFQSNDASIPVDDILHGVLAGKIVQPNVPIDSK